MTERAVCWTTCNAISSTGTEIASVQPVDSKWQCGVPSVGSTAIKEGVVLRVNALRPTYCWDGMGWS